MSSEIPILFQCSLDELVGMIHLPDDQRICSCGVLIVVGGPQYRVGSHRQFVTLARDLAQAGIVTMRFDYRGMGDSIGEQISFEETGPDIKTAIDVFVKECPHIEQVVLWGLCDAASACLMYSVLDTRVSGLALANPWVRSESGMAKVYLKHYYRERLLEKKFWLKLLKFQFNYSDSLKSIISQIHRIITAPGKATSETENTKQPFQLRMEKAFADFKGNILFIISGNDLTAQEFIDLVSSSKNWRQTIQKRQAHKTLRWCEFKDADHTFSSTKWKQKVFEVTKNWVISVDQKV